MASMGTVAQLKTAWNIKNMVAPSSRMPSVCGGMNSVPKRRTAVPQHSRTGNA